MVTYWHLKASEPPATSAPIVNVVGPCGRGPVGVESAVDPDDEEEEQARTGRPAARARSEIAVNVVFMCARGL
jgi:hypothetical protein